MAELLLRPLHEPDLLAYKALRDAMLVGHPEAFTSDAEAESRRDLASYRNRLPGVGATLFTLVALDGARLVGALTCEREARSKVQHIAHLVGMMVADSHRGRGVGRRLLTAALLQLRQTPGLAQVTLSVSSGNAAAVRLYTGLGFERYGRLTDAIRLDDGRSLDKDLMVLRL
jgi:ribosomal protein S18 acetylase RimI-like enzyme